MKKWNYQFPDEWGDDELSMFYNIEYQVFNWLRYLYSVHLRYNDATYAHILRKLRARLFS
jgi:hypothetical protein